MKKIIIASVLSILLSVYAMAQVDHDYNPNDTTPPEGNFLPVSQLPAAVTNALKIDFALDKPETWTKFPYAIKEYGFVYDKAAAGVKPDRYEVRLKTTNGDDLYAVYSKEGNLIATRETYFNSPMPASVKEKLAHSNYKDWAVIGTKEVIRYYYDKNSVDQHYRVTVQKGNIKRTLSFNYENDSQDNKQKN
jgi:hypothetical protein